MIAQKVLPVFLLLSALLPSITAFNILVVFMLPSKSHYFVGTGLVQGLAKAGHNVTMLSPFLQTKPTNYEEILITGSQELYKSQFTNFFEFGSESPLSQIDILQQVGLIFTEHTLKTQNVIDLMNSGRTFDVVIVEQFLSEALLGLGRQFEAKSVMGINTFGATVFTNNLIGNPTPLSFVPHPFLSYSDNMNFVERSVNLFVHSYEWFTMKYLHYPRQAKLFQEAFPHLNVSFNHVLRNDVGAMLINTHFTLGGPRPYLPNQIEVGGLNINREKTNLPEDLQQLINGAKDGVIYFSLGSNVRCAEMPSEKRDALVKAFGKLPQLVLWKWEDDNLPGKPDNVIIRKWFPQDAVLAHDNVKLFITHGGLLSTTEAVYFGKAIVGIPIFADQQLNMKRASKAGYSVVLDFNNITETAVSWALDKALNSPE